VIVVPAVAAAAATWLLLPPPMPVPGRAVGRRATGLVLAVVALTVVPHAWVAPLLVLAVASAGGLVLCRRRRLAREAEHRAALTAEVCDLLAAELAAGRPTEAALEEAARAWPEIRSVADACRLGGDVPAAFRDVARRPGADGLRLLGAGWDVSHRTGSGLAGATRRVADAVRRDQATRRVVAGELSSARATARLMAGLPVVALLMGSGAGADPWVVLFRTPLGLGCLAAGLAVGFAGLWWIELIAHEVDR
jgi:tight adherence protein B